MKAAYILYKNMGFVEIESYICNPIEGGDFYGTETIEEKITIRGNSSISFVIVIRIIRSVVVISPVFSLFFDSVF